MQIEENLRAGMTPEEARRDALSEAGRRGADAAGLPGADTLPLIENLLQDLRFAFRQLRKNPGFAVTAVADAGAGDCASVAMFAFVDAALMKPLPYPEPDRLVAVYESIAAVPRMQSFLSGLSGLEADEQSLSVAGCVGRHWLHRCALRTAWNRCTRRRVTDGFFRTLGVAPVLGRDFYAGEDLPGAPRTVDAELRGLAAVASADERT